MASSSLTAPSDSAPIVMLENIGMQFGHNVVHHNINLHVDQGEVVTILGPSGTGKTLILKMIVGLLRPTKGKVWVFDQELCAMTESDLRQMRRNVGMLFQGAALFDSLSVFENVAYPLREFRGHSESQIREIVEERLRVVGLPGISTKYPPQLSGGQKKRVGLARALASSPRVVLFDEPTTGLDPTAIRMIDDLILAVKKDFGITCVVVTHDIESAKRISDRWILVSDGVVVVEGPSRELAESHPEVKRFISGNWKDD
jgi:phospholipid/cholesterol/gamma-HCH transport system ATP-binding protein